VWLPCDLPPEQAERFIEDPNYFFQKKEDGVHLLASKNQQGLVDTRNRRGELHRIPLELAKVLNQMAPETMLDGEKLHEGGLVVFDMLYDAGRDLRPLSYGERLLAMLEWYTKFVWTTKSGLIRIVETAMDADAKRALAQRLKEENAEGYIIKDARAPYAPGRTDDWQTHTMFRVKFLKSLTAIVYRRIGDTKGSFDVLLIDGTVPTLIGTVTSQQFHDQLGPGESAIAEISYLYSTPSNKIVPTRLKRPNPWRTDKRPSDCTINQLIKGGRFAKS
jgi:hypothetical protein